MDQANTLRQLMNNRSTAAKAMNFKAVKVISVTSGKGGVGKTNVVANLAYCLQNSGKKVLVMDGDFSLANLNIVFGLETKGSIHEVIHGEKEIQDIILTTSTGIKVLPASSGITEMSNLSLADKTILMDRLESSKIDCDVLIIDTAAGINNDVLYLNASSDQVLVVVTPEPTSVTDAYALMKVMSQNHKVKRFSVLLNMVSSSKEAKNVFEHLVEVSDRFLNISLDYVGAIPNDRLVSQAILQRKPFCEKYPNAEVSKALQEISQNLMGGLQEEKNLNGNMQYFWRTLMMNEARV